MPPSSFTHYVAYYLIDRRDNAAIKRWFSKLPPRAEEWDEDVEDAIDIAEKSLGRLAVHHVSHELTTCVMDSTLGYNSPAYDCSEYIDILCGGTVLCDYPCVVACRFDFDRRKRLLQIMSELLAGELPHEQRASLVSAASLVSGAAPSSIIVAWSVQGT